MKINSIVYLVTAVLIATTYTTGEDTNLHHQVEIDDQIIEFDSPSLRYEVKTDLAPPIVASLQHRQDEKIITITYHSFVTYGEVDVDYDFLENHLKDTEKSYKKNKKNYSRVSLEKTSVADIAAPQLIFATNNGAYWVDSVITCFGKGDMVYYVSLECPEEQFDEAMPDYKSLLASIRIR